MDGLKIRLGLLGLGLAGFAVLSPLQAETASGPPLRMSTPEVATELLASVAAARPGTEILLGVRQQIAPGWHTYWRNPGDSGMATRISWTLPAGARGGELLWPAPRRFAEGSDSVFGYQDEVTLL
ncbi:MAG: hypothetical protein RIR00_274, partial [Pseudomonadota bacterium]